MKRSLILGCLSSTLLGWTHGFTRGTTLVRQHRNQNQFQQFRNSVNVLRQNGRSQISSNPLRANGDLSGENNDGIASDGKEDPDKLLGFLVLMTVPLSWGTYVPVVRYLYAIQPPVPGFVFSACYYALAAVTTTSLALWQGQRKRGEEGNQSLEEANAFPIRGGIELGAYLFIANCLQVIGLRTVESDRAGFLVQLTTVMVPFVEALFARKLTTVPVRTWFACIFAFIGLFVMGLDGKVLSDPISTFVAALTSFTQGDILIMGAAVLYTLHVVRLGVYARETTPMKLAASKATVETIFSLSLCSGFVGLSSVLGDQSGLLGFASDTGKEILAFFVSFKQGLASGTLSPSVLLPALGAVVWTGLITCAYTIYAQSFGQSRVSPTNANLIYTFQPIFTALFAWLLLGESMGPAGFVGGAIIAASVYLVASAKLGKFNEDDISLATQLAVDQGKMLNGQPPSNPTDKSNTSVKESPSAELAKRSGEQ